MLKIGAMPVTESQLEEHLLRRLGDLKYALRPDIRDRNALHANFRDKFQALNRVTLTDSEFERLLGEIVTHDVFEAATRLREISSFTRDDGTPLNYTLVNIKDWCKNSFEVVSQLRINTANSCHRYDVMLLINGVPVVQIELKSLGISPRKAMQQIVDYKSDPGNGYTNSLLAFVQLFVVSNRDRTYYFTNNNKEHFEFNADERFLPVYEFAAEDNRKITHLDEFAEAFLAKCSLGRMVSRYTVLVAGERQLLMMRPYQIYAVQQIVDCIKDNTGNGYIWHTTGSGKTLTSFKASTLLKYNDDLHKVLFVVDRKDLDKQTRDEFNRFQAGSVEENTNTGALVRRLLSDNYADKVIVTTIQKLGLALDQESKRNKQRTQRGQDTFANQLQPLRDKRMAIIFDECHRSQFGQTHRTIKEFFPRAQFFGFTGTPIFQENATVTKRTSEVDPITGEEQTVATLQTTAEIFEQRLHAYTITDAIEDRNVLKFHVDYFKPSSDADVKPSGEFTKKAIVDAILDKHDAATNGRKFNALLATGSINDAIDYYNLFEAVQLGRAAQNPDFKPLKIAAVFSPPADGDADVKQLQEDLPQEQADNREAPDEKKAALTRIITDYNKRYGCNHKITEFDAYYQDVQQRIKSHKFPDADVKVKNGPPGSGKVDLVIVCDMLLTGFDSKYLNTLYVDKNLKHHGLIQAFSRTNRVLNDTKPHGQILDFRAQQDNVDEAIRLFSGLEAGAGVEASREIWLVEAAPVVIAKLREAKADLDAFLASQGLAPTPSSVANLKGDDARAAFIEQFKKVQKLTTQLAQYTDLSAEQKQAIEETLPSDTARGFRGAYLETAKQLKELSATTDEPNPVVDDLDFELVLFASATIDYDYIMKLISDYSQTGEATSKKASGQQGSSKSKLTREQLVGLIQSDSKFLDERDEIAAYVDSLQAGRGLSVEQVREGYARFKAERQAAQLAALATTHGITPASLDELVEEVLVRMIFDGEKLTDLFAPLDLGWKERHQKELELMRGLVPLLKQRAGGRPISGLSAWEQ
jgi:type I restriction enzyme R subunit